MTEAIATHTSAVEGPTGPRRLFALIGSDGPTDLAEHRRHYASPAAHHGRARELIALAERAGLRGRGGAGFPTATKLRAVAARRRRAVVVANGTEGEPLSRKDVTLMQWQPHLVLDGAVIAAMAVGADAISLCIDRTQTITIAAMERALQDRIRWDPPSVPITLHPSPPRYVAGEETALVHWLNGGEARPTSTPPRPFERGVGGRPTLVDNVETLAHFAQINAFGDDWFRRLGTATEPGTALLSVSGAVRQPAVYETPLGTHLATVIDRAAPEHGVGAVLVGGYFGGWIDAPTAARTHVRRGSPHGRLRTRLRSDRSVTGGRVWRDGVGAHPPVDGGGDRRSVRTMCQRARSPREHVVRDRRGARRSRAHRAARTLGRTDRRARRVQVPRRCRPVPAQRAARVRPGPRTPRAPCPVPRCPPTPTVPVT